MEPEAQPATLTGLIGLPTVPSVEVNACLYTKGKYLQLLGAGNDR